MSEYTNINEGDLSWNFQDNRNAQSNPYYNYDHNIFQTPQLDFQSFGDGQDHKKYYNRTLENIPSHDLDSRQSLLSEPCIPNLSPDNTPESNDPPLLEELEIYPDRIMEKIVIVLNPFGSHISGNSSNFLTHGTDLAGPLFFCVVLALALLISNNKVYFGYIYGLSVVCCIIMYCLLTLMTTNSGVFTLASVSSILGYSLLPIVGLSVLGIFVSFRNFTGIMIFLLAVLWSSLSASRLFTVISGDNDQRPLITYPCSLVCAVFALLVIF